MIILKRMSSSDREGNKNSESIEFPIKSEMEDSFSHSAVKIENDDLVNSCGLFDDDSLFMDPDMEFKAEPEFEAEPEIEFKAEPEVEFKAEPEIFESNEGDMKYCFDSDASVSEEDSQISKREVNKEEEKSVRTSVKEESDIHLGSSRKEDKGEGRGRGKECSQKEEQMENRGCEKPLGQESDSKTQIDVGTREKSFVGGNSEKQFSGVVNPNTRMLIHTEDLLRCRESDKTFSNEIDLKVPYETHNRIKRSMAPKRSASTKAGSEPKRHRKMMTIAEKVTLLDMLKEGRSYAAAARHFVVNESTVRYIKKDEANIRKTAAITFSRSAKRVVTARNKTIVRMEGALAVWIADCRKKNIALDTNTIRTKALGLYENFAAKEPQSHDGDHAEEDEDDVLDEPQAGTSTDSQPQKRRFSASKGWFAKFQKRFGLKSVSLHSEAASADTSKTQIDVGTREKSFVGGNSEKQFSEVVNPNTRMLIHTEDLLRCRESDKTFSNEIDLKVPYETHNRIKRSMAPKRSASTKAGSEPKRHRKMMTIAEKVTLLDMLKEGRSYAAAARHFVVNESTVRYIKKDETNIRKTAAITFSRSAKRVVTARNKTIVRMEGALAVWIADCRKKNIALDTNTIRTKALGLYENFAAKEPQGPDGDHAEEDEDDVLDEPQAGTSTDSQPQKRRFSASKGWFAKFQKRFGLKSVSLHSEAASADTSKTQIDVGTREKSFVGGNSEKQFSGVVNPNTRMLIHTEDLLRCRESDKTFSKEIDLKVPYETHNRIKRSMAPKRSASTKAGSEPKRHRKMMTIAEKVTLLDMLKEGRSYAAAARHFVVNESTVRYIKKDEANIRKTAAITFSRSAKRVVTARNKTIVRMEGALAVWIADCRKKNIALDTNTIRTKALGLYENFAAKEPQGHDGDHAEEDEDDVLDEPQAGTSTDSQPQKRRFSASKGWFAKFQKRFGLKSVSLHSEAASADTSKTQIDVGTREKSFVGGNSEKQFSGVVNPNNRMLIHTEDLFRCREGDKTFSNKIDLKVHYETHNRIKSFKCSVCDKAFHLKINLASHFRIHTREKPFKCNVCDQAFSDRSSLTTHSRMHTGEKPFKCSVCDKAFRTKSNLARHCGIHTGENLFKCDVCDKAFKDKYYLARHLRFHYGEKPFKCNVCDKAFHTKSDLATHFRTHTGGKPFKCNVCDKAFSQKSSLSRHHKIHNLF
ncbi:uncharacterized protein [Palaemon carinicauda]|uniref:uncharacterized protein n=1 Tax=Palaemon carinicauda TaxID=392227 RepID=UPI0035B5D765